MPHHHGVLGSDFARPAATQHRFVILDPDIRAHRADPGRVDPGAEDHSFMTSRRYFLVTLRDTMRSPTAQRETRKSLIVGAALAACALVGVTAVPPPPSAYAARLHDAYLSAQVQNLSLSADS